jgi:drug/metabolite transporter (DMT)-like permease
MLASVFVFSCANALVKWTSATYPVDEIAFFRLAGGLIPTMVLVASYGGLPLLKTRHFFSHLWRGGAGVVSMVTIYYAFMMLPLADVTSISFAGPLFMTALSVPMLGEKVGIYRWSAVVVGFLGVLVITRPSAALFNVGALAAVFSAFAYAVAMISVRQMSRTEHPVTIVFYFSSIGTLAMSLWLPFGWVTPGWGGFAGLMAIGLLGGFAQYFQTQAFRLAPAAVAAPFNYVNILFAGLFGYLIWGEAPTVHALIGSAVVAASGLFIFYREAVRAREAQAASE